MLENISSLEKIILISSIFSRSLKNKITKFKLKDTLDHMPQKHVFFIKRDFMGIQDNEVLIKGMTRTGIERIEKEALDVFLGVYYGKRH